MTQDLLSSQLPVHALIVSAGKGTRFGADLPKQYLSVAGRTILEHSVSCLNAPCINDLTLVVAKDDDFVKNLTFDFDGKIEFAIGGAERFLSVYNGVLHLKSKGIGNEDWVLIHDGARPCLPRQDLMALIDVVGADDFRGVGAILATPVVDTLKAVTHGKIDRTVSRDGLYHAQTPQIFRLSALEQMLKQVIDQNLMITDEASGFEQLGLSVAVVMGSRFNVKLTYPDDLALIDLILQRE